MKEDKGKQLTEVPPGEIQELPKPGSEEAMKFELERARVAVKYWRDLIMTLLQACFPQDWVDFKGKPYLQGHGAERIAQAGGACIHKPEWDRCEPTDDGHFFARCYIKVSKQYMTRTGLREFFVYGLGGCSSNEPFFVGDAKQKISHLAPSAIDDDGNYLDKDGNSLGRHPSLQELRQACLDRGVTPQQWGELMSEVVMKKAEMNGISRAVTRFFAIADLTWEQLESFGFTKEDAAARVEFNGKKQEKKSPKAPATKSSPKGKSAGILSTDQKIAVICDVASQYCEDDPDTILKKATAGAYKKEDKKTGKVTQKTFEGWESPDKISQKALPIVLQKLKRYVVQNFGSAALNEADAVIREAEQAELDEAAEDSIE